MEFAWLLLTQNVISPPPKIFGAINHFQVPKNLTGACSGFGLVNQAVWAYSISFNFVRIKIHNNNQT